MKQERLEQIRSRLKLYYKAETAVLSGQAYTIGTRSLTRANLYEIRRAIKELETQESLIEKNGGKRIVKRVIPRDI